MASWFGSSKEDKTSSSPSKNQNNSPENIERVIVTDMAKEKINELILNAASPVLGVRLLAEATSPTNPEYSLAFVQEGEAFDDDTIIEFDTFNVYIDADSFPYVDKVQLDFITTGVGGGFRIDKQVKKGKVASGSLADRIQQVIIEQINPALALHGGNVQLIDVKETTAYIELGGGCKGCGMVDVTLKQGIEVMIKQSIPEITEVFDSTDHDSGNNPYYQGSK